jgi:sulfide:quinone oxidoreductase
VGASELTSASRDVDERSKTRPRVRTRPRVVIAGGGVAAIEGMIALRDLLDGFVTIELVAPEKDFIYRPLSVAEPFGLTAPRRFDLARIAADHGASLHMGTLERVEARRNDSRAIVNGPLQPRLAYDALLVAVGARPRDWLSGATHFAGPADVAKLRALVSELDEGMVESIAFAAPVGLSWTLPLYELALLTAGHVAERRRGAVRLAVVTPESNPLDVFGPAAAQHVRELCANRGIELRTASRVRSFENGRLALEGDVHLEADRVVALPELAGGAISGLPHDDDGFIPVDAHGAVLGLADVYAAGDGVAYPIKQGGLATQQADAAAEAIAASLGAAIEPKPFHPRLRGQLLTGLGPTYLTAGATEAGPQESSVAANPLWWPPSKIAGRYLAPYLASKVSIGRPDQLVERSPVASLNGKRPNAHREELRQLALEFADVDAATGDYPSALKWLETVEELDGLLSPELAVRQAQWRRLRR